VDNDRVFWDGAWITEWCDRASSRIVGFLEAKDMNRGKRIFMVLGLLLVVSSCGPVSKPLPPQTSVHLQARFEIPETLDGQAPSHTEMDYLVWLPEGYGGDPNKEWPLIFFLHGAGGGENDSKFVMSYGLPEVLYSGDQPEEFPFVVISPQAYPNVPWWEGDMLAILCWARSFRPTRLIRLASI